MKHLKFFINEINHTYRTLGKDAECQNYNDIVSWFETGLITVGEYLYLCRYNRKLNREYFKLGVKLYESISCM